MLPRGFHLSVASAGIKTPDRSDMALICSDTEASISGTFTTNRVKAAPVQLNMRRIRSGRGRAVVVNSGNANACTGRAGMRDARETAALMGKILGVPERLVYVCSTGVIGVPLPMEKIKRGIKRLARDMGNAGLEDAARAIMTTDTFPKFLSRTLKVGRREGVVSAICKGAGMIAPDMATMLCFLMTDIAVEQSALTAALKEAVEHSFNRVTVDGDRSTNDTVLAMSNGMLGNPVITGKSSNFNKFGRMLSEITYELSRQIARDGEGATKLIEVELRGARSGAEAKKGALAVANSLLVKTAIYGSDPNWGRIIASLGASGISIKEEKTDISLCGIKLFSKGKATGREAEARKALRKKEVKVGVDLNLGRAAARVLTCDLTEEYVSVNAEYTS
jgi:glutamate N-acetyltransferase/amino-acid N-acetyltransferase